MKTQRGYIFRRYGVWYVRFRDDVLQSDGTVARVQKSEPLCDVDENHRTKASVKQLAQDKLAPLNAGLLNPQSSMLLTGFVDNVYIKEYVEKKLRPASQKQYKDVWENHLKARMGKLTLRAFRTVHGEQMLAQIAAQSKLGRSSLRHCKAFLSGAFKQAKRLGVLDGLNPMQDVSIPRVPEPEEDTYAYSLPEIKSMLTVLPEPARTVVLTAAFTGLRKSELRGLTWDSYNGEQLSVKSSVWNSTVSEPKTKRSKAPIPIVRQLGKALEAHRLRAGKLAQPGSPIFQAGNGKPLNLDNLVNREIKPAIEKCGKCGKSKDEHPTDGHMFALDKTLCWHGWHAFRRGLATNLHALGADDKTIQAILRHSTVGLTMNIYVKTIHEDEVSAMDSLSEKMELCTVRAPSGPGRIN